MSIINRRVRLIPRRQKLLIQFSLLLVIFTLYLLYFKSSIEDEETTILEIQIPSGIDFEQVRQPDLRSPADPFPDTVNKTHLQIILENNAAISTSSHHERCQIYFDMLYDRDPDWHVSHFDSHALDRNIIENKDQFIQSRIDSFKEEHLSHLSTEEEQDTVIEEKDLQPSFMKEWKEQVRKNLDTENVLMDASSHLRAYGACYLNGDRRGLESFKTSCNEIENRIFRWFSGKPATFTCWDGSVSKGTTQPGKHRHMIDGDKPHATQSNGCFLNDYKNQLDGKGIAISAADIHVPQLISLIASLRALGNKLPIQVVHSGDLSAESQVKLINAARGTSFDVNRIDNLAHAFDLRNISYTEFDGPTLLKLFTQQDLWFVDVSETIHQDYKEKFGGYSNKFLAYFFNSFQHTILMDVDTVVLVDLDSMIFNSTKYTEHGAYFFKDRELNVKISGSDTKFFKKLMPSRMDSRVLDIPETTEYTTSNRLMGGDFEHLMEAGIVAIDRVRHFEGVLGTLQLNLWNPVRHRVWGDKELFWMGLSLVGDEDYSFNTWASGTLGEIQDHDEDGPFQICSTHPAHISSDDNSTLLWFNSGFLVCKKSGAAQEDWDSLRFSHETYPTVESLEVMYQSYQKIDAVVVPFGTEYDGASKETADMVKWDVIDKCKRLVWCGHGYGEIAMIGDNPQGKIIRIDSETKKWHQFMGSVHQFAMSLLPI